MFFAVIAKARVGSRRGACIAVELAKLFVAYATEEGAWEHQDAFLFPVVAPTGKEYVGIVPGLALATI